MFPTSNNEPDAHAIPTPPQNPNPAEAAQSLPLQSTPLQHISQQQSRPGRDSNDVVLARLLLGESESESGLQCPIFLVEIRLGQPHTCNGVEAKSMANVRHHLRCHRRHNAWVKQCTICKEEVIGRNKSTGVARYNAHKTNCHNSQRGRRRRLGQQIHWEKLFQKLVSEGTIDVQPLLRAYNMEPVNEDFDWDTYLQPSNEIEYNDNWDHA